jgi:hypothetical protein
MNMIRQMFASRALHYFVRGFSVLAFSFTYSGSVSRGLSFALANGRLGNIVGGAVLSSLILLPALLLAEAAVLWNAQSEHRAIWIDALFVAGWYVAFIGSMLFTISHHVVI